MATTIVCVAFSRRWGTALFHDNTIYWKNTQKESRSVILLFCRNLPFSFIAQRPVIESLANSPKKLANWLLEDPKHAGILETMEI
jgi:hypothetical protein